MATVREISSVSRPSHLTSIDWNNTYHRTSVASCLVQGVYRMELDRQNNRVGPSSQAKPWWEQFHFTLVETLICECDNSIYGAIFEYKISHYNYQNTPGSKVAPRYVIAFRGTVLKEKTWFCDVGLDLRCIFDTLHQSTRFAHAVQAIHTTVLKHSDASVWLAGHSLGAGLALLAGKTMSRSGFFLESYIFNPPISSIPLEQLTKNKVIKGGIRVAGSLFKAGIAMMFKDLEDEEAEQPKNLASWIPYLYVNSIDPICAEYIGYFKNKTFMAKVGLNNIESIATRNPLRSLLVGIGGSSSLSHFSTEPLHLLPSAYMTVHTNASHDRKASHRLRQWWEPLSNAEYVLYQFNS